MSEKTLIIGGVAGGATTAARLRRRKEDMEIILFEKGEYISYANCGLPYYVGDVIKSRDALLLQTPAAMRNKFNIDVRTQNEVTAIHPETKTVSVKNHATGTSYEESYDNLVIATGSTPLKPPIPGIDSEAVFTLWSIPDMDYIKAFMEAKKPRHAAVIGGGFIGIEMAENLHEAGLSITLIEMQNQVMAPLDFEMANLLHENMRMNRVNLILEDGVSSFETTDKGVTIHLKSGKSVQADMVLLSIGVKPNSTLAKEAGITLNQKGGIVVNEYLETSVPGIYAVGDVIEVEHFVQKERTMIPLAGPANKQGRIAADNIAGDHKKYEGSMGTAVAKVFDMNAASVGVSEKVLAAAGKEKGKDFETILINQKSHAGYYPGATPVSLKMIFTKKGEILGAQIVGQDGVDKRIDTIATTMRLNGSIYDLMELELAYAPPFSSAKDPVNMLGFVAENVINGLVRFIQWDELDQLLKNDPSAQDYTVLDVTEEMERMVFSIPGSYHIPLGQLHKRFEELKKDQLIIPYCSIGVRSYNAARILQQNGFSNVKVLAGGTTFYKSMHHNDEKQISYESGSVTVQETEKKISSAAQPAQAFNLENIISNQELRVLDCCGLQCPGPIMKVNEQISDMKQNEVLKVSATDMGFARDIDAWCRRTGNTLLKTERENRENIVYIKKGTDVCDVAGPGKNAVTELPQGKTLVVFSGDMDKALAAFIIANGAAAMGRPVTMFFTFWGLNILRKTEKVSVKKSFIEKMFGFMMPRGVNKLKLSKMNMSGMGTKMMKMVMKDKNVSSLEELMKQAMKNGVKLIACTMSMDVMGIQKEELIEGVEFAGVATYLGDAEQSNVNLFI